MSRAPLLAAILLALAPLAAGCLGDTGAGGDGMGAPGSTLPFTVSPLATLPNAGGTHAAEPHVAARAVEGAPPVLVVGSIEYMPGESPLLDRRFDMAIHRSLDGGITWESGFVPRSVFAPFDPLGRTAFVGDPVLAYAPSGALFLAGVAASGAWKDGPTGPVLLQANDLTVFVTRSDDDGATWSPARFYRQGAGTFGFPVLFAGVLQDKPWIDVGPDGVVHVTWTEFLETQPALRYVRSPDEGATWEEPRILALAKPGYNGGPEALHGQPFLQGSTVAAPGGGLVYVSATEDSYSEDATAPAGANQAMWVSRDNGVTFERVGVVGPALAQRFGTVFADPAAPDRAFVVQADGSDAGRVYLVETQDGGATWSDPLFLAPDREGQQQPTGLVDAAGRARLAFYDAGHEGGERLTLVVVDNGTVVYAGAPEGPPTSPGFARRDYIGIAGVGDTAWAVWVQGEEAAGTSVGLTTLGVGQPSDMKP